MARAFDEHAERNNKVHSICVLSTSRIEKSRTLGGTLSRNCGREEALPEDSLSGIPSSRGCFTDDAVLP
jgi:hypothetical protein